MKMALVFLIIILTNPLLAEKDVLDIAADYNRLRKGVGNLQKEKRQILSELYKIEKDTSRLVIKKNEVNERKMKLDFSLKKVSREIVRIEAEIEKQIPDLIDRLKFTEQVNSLPWLYTFLTSQSLADLDNVFQSAKHINNHQGETLSTFIGLINNLEEHKEQLGKTALEIIKSQKELSLKEGEISKNQQSKKRILTDLNIKLKKEKKDLARVKAKGKKALENSFFTDLSLLFGSDFFDQKSLLPHPIAAAVSIPYGLSKELLQDSIQLSQKGYFYESNKAKLVSVVAPGRVRYVGQQPGYGRIVVIDHGSRYYTVYANLKSTKVKKGQEVGKKQALGLTGHSHLQWGRGLYFEIRHFSQPQDPKLWLKKEIKRLATI